mmetsp:Transcript_4771/g.9902  ORF Transcript_4771/g.9902 Transcript_4771/m.9902 type:complete len:309 (-) Transcript_4771:129-1055(-)
MGYLRDDSDSDVQSEKFRLVNPPVLIGIGSTVATTSTTDTSGTNKKRKRDTTTLTTTSVRPADFNEISDDSDVSSDDEKPLQEAENRLGIHKRRKHHRHKVVFGEASSTTRYYPSPVTKAELRDLKRDLWFTKQDRQRSQAECLKTLKIFRIQNAEEVAQFGAVYKTSMSPLSQETSDYLEKATVSVPLTIRGMEWGISPKLKKRRKEHIQSVLALQENIEDATLRARFVSSRSVQSSRPARIMARIIGEGDASAGTTSTALNVTTVPIRKTKLPLGEQQQNSKAIETKKTTKLGQTRRRRRPLLCRK